MLIITGCGRSGTHYTTKVLRSLGLDIYTERLGKDGVADWKLAIEPYRDFYDGEIIEEAVIIHQVRHPLDTIASLHTFANISWAFIQCFIPMSGKEPVLLKAMKYWYYWNLIAQRKSQFTYRVEDLIDNLGEIERLSDYKLKDHSIALEIPTNISSRTSWSQHPSEVKWGELKEADPVLGQHIVDLAKDYGYADIPAHI